MKKNKNILILGLARSGIAAADLAKSKGANVYSHDDGQGILFKPEDLDIIDEIIISPGVPYSNKLVIEAKKKKISIISEMEFAYRYCNKPIIAITGTNGKTTTTSLIDFVLRSVGKKSIAAGNIGLAFSAIIPIQDDFEVIALEVSNFQLDYIRDFRPYIAILLNITPDHLDRYDSYDDYVKSKMRICENQKKGDLFIDCRNISPESHIVIEGTYLKGAHNRENIHAVICALEYYGLSFDEISKAVKEFKPIKHRMEDSGTIDGVNFINDSKATNIGAVEKALLSFDKKIFLIAGGKDKAGDFDSLKHLVKDKVAYCFLIGEAADKIKKSWESVVSVIDCKDMQDAVCRAFDLAEAGDIVLLSPACASFDMYKNYEQRGEDFKTCIKKLHSVCTS